MKPNKNGPVSRIKNSELKHDTKAYTRAQPAECLPSIPKSLGLSPALYELWRWHTSVFKVTFKLNKTLVHKSKQQNKITKKQSKAKQTPTTYFYFTKEFWKTFRVCVKMHMLCCMYRVQIRTFSQFSVSTMKIHWSGWQFNNLLGPQYCYFLPNGLEKTTNSG